MAISMGHIVDVCDPRAPSGECVIHSRFSVTVANCGSDVLEMVIDLERPRPAIREGTADPYTLCSIVSALGHFDPFQVVVI